MSQHYRFRIDGAYTPATIPMDRLAEYMAAFAGLLGESAAVHFSKLEPGSAVLVAVVDEPAQPKVRGRVLAVREGQAGKELLKAYDLLDAMLRVDNARGELIAGAGAVVLEFPGRNRPESVAYGPFRQDGHLDGQIFRLGGKDETIHIHIREGGREHTSLETNIGLAQELRHHLLGPTLRFHGSGLWYRSGGGDWELRNFRVHRFDVLDEAPLLDIVTKLRGVRGNTWAEVDDPVRELLRGRGTERSAL